MKHIIFTREDNDFSDILRDPALKKLITMTLFWDNYLHIGVVDNNEAILSYIELKYSESIVNNVCKDFTPIPWVHYRPK